MFMGTPVLGFIDNIVVSNTIGIEPPPSTRFYMQTGFFATVCTIAVIIASIIVFLGKRKHQPILGDFSVLGREGLLELIFTLLWIGISLSLFLEP